VTGKRLCDRQVGDVLNGRAHISQQGRDAILVIDPTIPIPLSVTGGRAIGVYTSGAGMLEFSLRIAGEGELTGTMTYLDSAIPCSETVDVTGTRENQLPSGAFAGDWLLQTEATQSACDGVTVGESETLCRRIRLDQSTVTIEDEDGLIQGVGDGDRAVLRRWTEGERLTYFLDVNGDQMSGTIERYNFLEECYTSRSVLGTRRAEGCGSSEKP
jgi:hypothetical protein